MKRKGSKLLAKIESSAMIQKKQLFLQALEQTGFIVRASRISGIPQRTLYDLKERDKGFAESWDKAYARGKEWRRDYMEYSFFKRGFKGLLDPIYQSGKRVWDTDKEGNPIRPASKRIYDTTAAIFLAKCSGFQEAPDPNAGRSIEITLHWETPDGTRNAVRVSA